MTYQNRREKKTKATVNQNYQFKKNPKIANLWLLPSNGSPPYFARLNYDQIYFHTENMFEKYKFFSQKLRESCCTRKNIFFLNSSFCSFLKKSKIFPTVFLSNFSTFTRFSHDHKYDFLAATHCYVHSLLGIQSLPDQIKPYLAYPPDLRTYLTYPPTYHYNL